MAVGASAKVGRASPPGGQAHGASIGGFFVESGCTSSVAELAEKSALALPASGLSPGRGSYPTFMDRPSGTNFVQTPMLSGPSRKFMRHLARRRCRADG